MKEIAEIVAEYYQVNPKMLGLKSREVRYVIPRQMAMYFGMKLIPQNTLTSVSRHFNRTHATVIHAIDCVKSAIQYDKQRMKEFKELSQLLQNESICLMEGDYMFLCSFPGIEKEKADLLKTFCQENGIKIK